MLSCVYCSIEFPDDTYLDDFGVCGAEPCREAYWRGSGIAEKILERCEKEEYEVYERFKNAPRHVPVPSASAFRELAYVPKADRSMQIDAIIEILVLFNSDNL